VLATPNCVLEFSTSGKLPYRSKLRHHSHPRVEVEGSVEVLLSFYLSGSP